MPVSRGRLSLNGRRKNGETLTGSELSLLRCGSLLTSRNPSRSGVLVLNANFTDAAASYTDDAYRNDLALGARVTALPNTAALRTSGLFPAEVQFAADGAAYVNYDGGWAHASAGVARMCARVEEMGGRVQKGVGVEGLVREGGRCVGVRMKDGEVWQAEVVVLAVGAWTAGLFPELGMEERCLATG